MSSEYDLWLRRAELLQRLQQEGHPVEEEFQEAQNQAILSVEEEEEFVKGERLKRNRAILGMLMVLEGQEEGQWTYYQNKDGGYTFCRQDDLPPEIVARRGGR